MWLVLSETQVGVILHCEMSEGGNYGSQTGPLGGD
jgi:hypothetical protein